MNVNTLAVAVAALLLGSVTTAAYVGNREVQRHDVHSRDVHSRDAQTRGAQTHLAATAIDGAPQSLPGAGDQPVFAQLARPEPQLEFADIVSVKPITRRAPLYADVIGSSPVRETVSTDTPRQICEDVVVQERLPERDGNVGGTVAGALIGGLIGNQVGDGNGRKLATVAGAVGGGFAGREIDRRHVGGRVLDRSERQCRTVTETHHDTRTVAWDVSYREPDGRTGSLRTERKPGRRITLGEREEIVAYDVSYRYRGEQRQVRLDEHPGERLPVIDGNVLQPIAQTATALRP